MPRFDRGSGCFFLAVRSTQSHAVTAGVPPYSVVGMFVVWTVAAVIILLHTTAGIGYVRLLGAQGLRGASEAATPLRQVIPARYADTQMWVRHVLDGQATVPRYGRITALVRSRPAWRRATENCAVESEFSSP